MREITETTTVRERCIELTGDDIRGLLRDKLGIEIPASAKVSVMVPGGGNWANTDLEIDKDRPLEVVWTETETE